MVFFMVCGLALFYAGLVPARNAVNTMKMNFFTLAVIPLLWVSIGYTFAFSGTNGFFGDFEYVFFRKLPGLIISETKVPELVVAIFQMMFAVIAAALISGAVVERMKFSAFIIFIILWSLLVYSMVVHWVWSDHGWLKQMGVIDFAGGYAIHICAGFSALVLAIMVKPRKYLSETSQHNIPFVVLGACILWFGYFSFNSGSAMAVNDIAVISFINTALGAATAIITWIVLDFITKRNILTVNIAVAAVVGLVSITPGAGFIDIDHAFFTSLITTLICYFSFHFLNKLKNKVDDSLDVFVCHGLSGLVGVILVGFFATTEVNPDIPAGLLEGNYHLVLHQLFGAVVVGAYAIAVSFIIVKVLRLFMHIRVSEEEELAGLDTHHGESAYEEVVKNKTATSYHMNMVQRKQENAAKLRALMRKK
jgi:Amt family ammonium transporter